MSSSNKFQIQALTKSEMCRLIASNKFDTLKPIECDNCRNKRNFSRQIFLICGVPSSKRNDDLIQNIIGNTIRKNHGIEYLFFKTYKRKFYVDSAICSECSSTKVIYDIELTDDKLLKISRMLGRPVEEIRKGIEKEAEKFTNKAN